MTTTPVRYDRLQAGLVASVAAALPGLVAVWARQGLPSGLAPDELVMFEALDEPSSPDTSVTTELPTAATLTVTAADGPVSFRVAGLGWSADGASAEELRDGLLDAIGPEPLVDATFTANGTDTILIEGEDVGDLHGLAVSEGITLLVTAVEVADVSIDLVTIRCAANFYSRETSPRAGSRSMARRWIAAASGEAGSRLFSDHGIVVSFGDPQSLDGLSGPEHESRTRVPLTVSMPAIWAEAIDTVDTISGTLNTREPTAAVEIEIDAA